MFFTLCILAVFAVNIDFSASHSCESLKNVMVLLHDKNGGKFNKTINGCIERIKFENNVTVTKAYIKGQTMPQLGRDSVRNMMYLTTVFISHCDLRNVTPTAFRNVPMLKNVEISYNNKLEQIPKGIFDFDLIPQLELLKLRHNEIRLIEDQSFYNLTNLKQIKLDNNKLEFWRREWFVNTTALEVMHFQFNKIKTIPKRAFVGFGKLRVIFFDNNDISEIQPDAFKEIRSLEYLGLGHNKLTVLEDYSFPNTLRIRAFVISGNYLNYLSNAVLKKLAAVEMVMDYNPWKCPCLERIYYWLYIKNGKIKIPDNCIGNNVPVCAAPSGFSDSCVDTVDSELTQRYLSTLKNISPAVDQNCFRLE